MRQIRANLAATPHPFLKWAGGKGQLLTEILRRIERAGAFGQYHEPFVGGGAVFFGLTREGRLGGTETRLSDNNAGLIETYQVVRNNPERLISLLERHRERHGKEYYYAVRAAVPADPTERAARIIYLNRTCFNGLYRENSKGEFNVPIGDYKNPRICDEANLRAVAAILKTAHVEQRHFATVLDHAAPGDFVYFDPPYHPVSKTSSFTAYDKGGFGENDQRELAAVFGELTRRGVKALLSNSMTDLVRDLYGKYQIECVHATRAVNSRPDRRGAVEEALVRNF